MGLLTDVFGSPAAGLLSDEQVRGAEKHALRNFGLRMMMASGETPNFLQAIAAGTMAGREAYEQFGSKARSVDMAQDIDQLLEQGLTPQSLADTYTRALRGGDLDTVRAIGPLLNTLMGDGGSQLKLVPKDNPQTGYIDWHDPTTGQVVLEGTGDEDILAPALRDDKENIIDRFERKVAPQRDVANSYRRVLSATSALINYQKEAAYARENGLPLPEAPTAAAMAAISSFARLLDPGSVVRTEEFKIVTNQGDLWDKLNNWWMQIKEGVMPENLAQQLQDEARRQTAAQRESYLDNVRQAHSEGVAVGIDPEKFLKMLNPFDSALAGFNDGTLELMDVTAWNRQQEIDSEAFRKDPERQQRLRDQMDRDSGLVPPTPGGI
jgi:hypothetical protein